MSRLIEIAKPLAKAALRQYYSGRHVRAARAKLGYLEAAGGPLNSADRKRCDDYAVEVLGHKRYAHWLHVYAHVAGQFKEGWIPDNFYGECVVQHTSGRYGELSVLRSLNTLLFDVPEFPDLAAQVNGMVVARDGRTVAPKDLAEVLFADGDRIVFKSDLSQSGIGVRFIDRKDFDPDRVAALGAGLFQPFIRQHDLFQRLCNCPAVATLRLTTAANDQGQVSLRGAYLRFGQSGMDYLMSSGEIAVPVDRTTGELSPTGRLPTYVSIDRHPESDLPFAGQFVPSFADCVRVALLCHARLPYVRCIGWDMGVDTDGAVKIMEWNGGHNGIKFTEATQGPGFADLNWERFRPK